MRALRWPTGSIRRQQKTVGPRHDPYNREIYSLTLRGQDYTLIVCGLAGFILKMPDGTEFKAGYWGCDAEIAIERKKLDRICRNHTGYSFRYWTERIWDRYEMSRMRRDPEGYDRFYDMDDCMYGHP